MSDNVLEQKKFILEDIIQLSVLTHAEIFRNLKTDDFLGKVEEAETFALKELAPLSWNEERSLSIEGEKVELPPYVINAWKLLNEEGWNRMTSSESAKESVYPETIAAASFEAILTHQPAAGLIMGLTLEVAKLIEQYGTFPKKEEWVEKLYSCEWTGIFSLAEPDLESEWKSPKTVAVKTDEGYQITGIKDFVAGSGHELTERQIYVVKAEISDSSKTGSKTGLFAVPSHRSGGNNLIGNGIRVISVYSMNGFTDLPFCKLSFGQDQTCIGYLLSEIDDAGYSVVDLLKGPRLLLVSQFLGRLNQARQYFEGAITSHATRIDEANQNDPMGGANGLYENPQILETWMKSEILSGAMRGAALRASFFADCAKYGGEAQRQYFNDLHCLYATILKPYVSQTVSDLMKNIENALGGFGQHQGTLLTQVFDDIRVSSVIGGVNQHIADEVLREILVKDNGRVCRNLLSQFQSTDTQQAKSGPVREAVAIWQEFQGGLIVFLDDLQTEYASNGIDAYLPYSKAVIDVLGDVIMCYHLIDQAIGAEKKLEEGGVNFFNLQNDILNYPNLIIWYNKLVAVEYFAVHVLSLKENLFHLIQRKPETVPAYIPISNRQSGSG